MRRLLGSVLVCAALVAVGCDNDDGGGAAAPGDVAQGSDTGGGGGDSVAPTDAAGADTATGADAAGAADAVADGGTDAGGAAVDTAVGDAGGTDTVIADAGGVDTSGADASPDASGPCLPEGTPTNVGATVPCCPGLEALPTAMSLPDGTCLPARCLDCLICVKGCGDGACTTGEDACSCPADCAAQNPGGPGAVCEKESDCLSGGCLPEASGYPTGGYCTGGVCNPEGEAPQCPAGAICVSTVFSEAFLCMPACHADTDCREGLTCEAFSELPPTHGEYLCWESDLGKPNPQLGHGLGETCASDTDCISHLCLEHPTTGSKVCAASCNDDRPCKAEQLCNPMGGCGFPGCGACFTM